ncbi:MAG: hypothetical protein ACJAXX_000486 [Roseivirga sp.]|jgi:hypothetical protein
MNVNKENGKLAEKIEQDSSIEDALGGLSLGLTTIARSLTIPELVTKIRNRQSNAAEKLQNAWDILNAKKRITQKANTVLLDANLALSSAQGVYGQAILHADPNDFSAALGI